MIAKRHRISLARIISDMIKADNIIEEREIKEMKVLMKTYGINKDDMSEARGIRFSEAVNQLRELKQEEKNLIFENINKLALVDNTCVQKEALLLLALKYCLIDIDNNQANKIKGNGTTRPKLISCPTGESTINEPYIVYVESQYDEKVNAEIEDETRFKLMVTTSKLYGFNFIYIPKLVQEFKNMDKQYVMDVISYMAPRLGQKEINSIYGRLSQMTTEDFFKNVLYERLNVKIDQNISPSLLINIGTSVVPYCIADGPVQYYTEFLCIPLYKSTIQILADFFNFYKKIISIQQGVIQGNDGHFKYFGFYKALFDFLIAPPPVEPDLIFAGQNHLNDRYEIYFKYSDKYTKQLILPRKEYEIYYKIVKSGYNRAKDGNIAPEVSHIKNKLKSILNEVANKDKYLPCREHNTYSIKLEKNKIFVRMYSDSTQTSYVDKVLTRN